MPIRRNLIDHMQPALSAMTPQRIATESFTDADAAVVRLIEIYERNRESLIHLRDAGLRANIHQLTLRLAMPIDGLFDTSQEIASLEGQLKSRTLDATDREEIEARVAELKERRDGVYEYSNGVNYRAMAALVIGVAVALIGLVIPAVRFLYDYAWFVGFVVSGAIHIGLAAPKKSLVGVTS